MRHSLKLLIALAPACLCLSVNAESLRCTGGIADEGDSRVSVLYKCGQPLLKDSFCAPLYFSQSLQTVPEPIASAFVACQQTDEWLYERGSGSLVATVRFRGGKVLSITYGRVPQ